jgi:hypothetical protein
MDKTLQIGNIVGKFTVLPSPTTSKKGQQQKR